MRKYSLAVFLAVFIFAFLPSMQVQAEGSDGFELDGTGTVTLRSQHAAKEEISSLQFSLTVDSAEAAQVEFEFGQNNARIAEFRYDENAKQLNIYMAGVDALFAENTEALTIGKIILRDNSGNAVDGTVSVVENSLQYVYGEELKPMESVEVPGAVLIGPSGQNPPPEQTPQDPVRQSGHHVVVVHIVGQFVPSENHPLVGGGIHLTASHTGSRLPKRMYRAAQTAQPVLPLPRRQHNSQKGEVIL